MLTMFCYYEIICNGNKYSYNLRTEIVALICEMIFSINFLGYKYPESFLVAGKDTCYICV
jgi:hypothetical protein